MKIRATTMMKYRGSQDEALVATRLEIAWADDETWLDVSGLRSYEEEDWALILNVMILGARRASIQFEHRELWNYD